MATLLLATNNAGKVREFRSLLAGEPFALTTPRDAGIDLEVEEDGETLRENAAKKAVAFSEASGLAAMADDSGLFIDRLNGEPGVHSARYAGPGASDRDRVALVLERLAGVQAPGRTACFRAVIAVAAPGAGVSFADGECCGIISTTPAGESGFGYDPIFLFPEYEKTMAELDPDAKNSISHRGRAVQAALPALRRLFA